MAWRYNLVAANIAASEGRHRYDGAVYFLERHRTKNRSGYAARFCLLSVHYYNIKIVLPLFINIAPAKANRLYWRLLIPSPLIAAILYTFANALVDLHSHKTAAAIARDCGIQPVREATRAIRWRRVFSCCWSFSDSWWRLRPHSTRPKRV